MESLPQEEAEEIRKFHISLRQTNSMVRLLTSMERQTILEVYRCWAMSICDRFPGMYYQLSLDAIDAMDLEGV